MSQKETIEEFLARGGVITVCPPQPVPEEIGKTTAGSTAGTGAALMSLSEGSLFYSQKTVQKPRKRKFPDINVSALPPSLLKYLPKREPEVGSSEITPAVDNKPGVAQ